MNDVKQTLQFAKALRKFILEQNEDITDEEADAIAAAFPEWDGNAVEYGAGDRVRYEWVVYKCLQGHTSQPTWQPTTAYSLWARVLTDASTPAPWQQPGADNAYMSHDRVTFEGHVYESLIDNNVWSPTNYPQGWQMID